MPRPAQELVHVHNDPEELGRVYQADLAIPAGMDAFATAAAALPPVDGAAPGPRRTAAAHAD